MAGRIVMLDTSIHQTVQQLLPWYATEALSADEAALVREHLRTCTQCRMDMERQRALHAALAKADAMPELDAGQAFARLSVRLAAPRRKSLSDRLVLGLGVLRNALQGSPVWTRWTMTIQAALIAGLVLMLIPQQDTRPSYRGLGAPANANGDIIVMFRPETTEQEWRQVLRDNEARVVDGPTAAGAYVLSVPEAKRAQAMAALRSSPGVRLAQPLDSRDGR